MDTRSRSSALFFFKDPATTEIYTLSLHDALPIYPGAGTDHLRGPAKRAAGAPEDRARLPGSGRLLRLVCAVRRTADRKSTRLNSSHANISYAVFCLKKKPQLHSSHALL